MPISDTARAGNALHKRYADRLGAIRVEINTLLAQPYCSGGPHRKSRDEFILNAIAADIHARLCQARAAA